MATLSEDDIYRASTQYRLWSFTPAALASLRAQTNAAAAGGVRAAITSQNEKENAGDVQVECLTAEEEQKLVEFYCIKAIQLSDFCEFPTNVKATAVQYMKRFYLSNSPMTYHPREIMLSALYLSTKTENHYISLKNFTSKLEKSSPDDVIAPEFLITQALRFAFDVRHPNRGLEGGFMELIAIAKGERGEEAAKEAMAIAPIRSGRTLKSQDDVIRRIQQAHDGANKVLKTAGILTDAYFHFTPPQIWMSAMLLVDEPLTKFLVGRNISQQDIKMKIFKTLANCRQMLEKSPSADPGSSELEELKRIDKKVYRCRNPDKLDLVGLNKASKREGETENGLGEKTIKKRKLERERAEKEAEDLFGPALSSSSKG